MQAQYRLKFCVVPLQIYVTSHDKNGNIDEFQMV